MAARRIFITFAATLSYGVMVAQQFLVLFVVVRIRLGQHNKGFLLQKRRPFFVVNLEYGVTEVKLQFFGGGWRPDVRVMNV